MAVRRHHGQKQHGKQRAYFNFTAVVHHPGSQPEAGADAETLERCLLACLACFLRQPRSTCPVVAPPIGLGSSQQSLIKKTHRRLAYKEILWRPFFFFSTESPSSQMTVTCVKLTINQQGRLSGNSTDTNNHFVAFLRILLSDIHSI